MTDTKWVCKRHLEPPATQSCCCNTKCKKGPHGGPKRVTKKMKDYKEIPKYFRKLTIDVAGRQQEETETWEIDWQDFLPLAYEQAKQDDCSSPTAWTSLCATTAGSSVGLNSSTRHRGTSARAQNCPAPTPMTPTRISLRPLRRPMHEVAQGASKAFAAKHAKLLDPKASVQPSNARAQGKARKTKPRREPSTMVKKTLGRRQDVKLLTEKALGGSLRTRAQRRTTTDPEQIGGPCRGRLLQGEKRDPRQGPRPPGPD